MQAMPTITEVLENWIRHYQLFSTETWQHYIGKRVAPVTRESAIERMNAGDCGTTAIAVSHVFNTLAREHQKTGCVQLVSLWDNFNHAFVEFDGRYYDTMTLAGEPDISKMMEADAPNMKEECLDLGTIFSRYIHRDRIGARLIRMFCQRYYIEEPKEVTDLLASAGRPDSYYDDWCGYANNQLDACDAFRAMKQPDPEPTEPVDIEGPLDPDPSAVLLKNL